MTRRVRIHIGVGDVLETVGAALACFAVAHLAGLFWGVLLAALFLIVAGNLIYAQARVAIELPNRQDRIVFRYRLGVPWRTAKRVAVTMRAWVRRP